MTTEWRDPDTGLVHHIYANSRVEAEAKNTEGLVMPCYDQALAQRLNIVVDMIAREVTMTCGKKIQVDQFDAIMPEGDVALLRPWLTTRDIPTCLWCVKMRFEPDHHVSWWAYEMQAISYP